MKRRSSFLLTGVLIAGVVASWAALAPPASAAAIKPAAGDKILRVYDNNIENLVFNQLGEINPATGQEYTKETCVRYSAKDNFTSFLNAESGNVVAPDLLILQQVRSQSMADAYADQLGSYFGYADGTYKAIVAQADPEPWGGHHLCGEDPDLGDLKKKQTNAIIYNSARLTHVATSAYWSTGWYSSAKMSWSYNNGAGCRLYKPPTADGDFGDSANVYRWKRTSAIAAKFTFKNSGKSVFAATMHLPQENKSNACGGLNASGDPDKGIGGSGMSFGGTAEDLRDSSDIRVIGIDANRLNAANALSAAPYGMSSFGGNVETIYDGGNSVVNKIDYLFVGQKGYTTGADYLASGKVTASGTKTGTKSNHKALFAFVNAQ